MAVTHLPGPWFGVLGRSLPRLAARATCILFFTCTSPWAANAPPDAAAAAPAGLNGDPAASSQAEPLETATELVQRADDDQQLAARVEGIAASDATTTELMRRLEKISAEADAMLRANTAAQLRHMPVMRLESLERHWRFDMERFERWRDDLNEATGPVLEESIAVTRRRAKWEADRERVAAKELPAVLAARIDTLIAQLRTAENRLAAPLAAQLDLRQRGSEVQARIRQGQRVVTRTIQEIDRQLFRVDSLALWDARSVHVNQADMSTSVWEGASAEARFAREYAGLGSQRQLMLHTMQLLLLPLLIWMAARARRRSELAGPGGPMFSLTRPFSLWLLLAPMVVLVLQPDAPLLVHEVAMLVAVVPVIRLTPPEDRRHLGAWTYLACGLFLMLRAGLLLGGSPFAYRIFLVLLCALGIAAMLWLLRHLRASEQPDAPWRWRRQLRAGAWGAVSFLSIAIVLNLAGNVSLAETLTAGVVDSGYLALMLHVAVRVCVSLINLLFQRPTAEREHLAALKRVAIRLVSLAGLIGWLVYSMERFRVFRPLYAALCSALAATFEVGEISISLGNVLVFVVAVLIAFWVSRGVRVLVHDEILNRIHVSRGVGNSVASLTYYGVLVMGLFLALSAAGFKISQLTIVFGALGVGIGFGLQGVVGNFVAGLVLMFERPIRPGDLVDAGSACGTVGEIGLRATTIRTFDGADVVVPNAALLADSLTNWTLRDQRRRIEIQVGVAYGSHPPEVAKLLRTTASQTPGVAASPEPAALLMEFGASSLDFSVRAWTDDADSWLAIRSDLATRIHRALADAGIEIPFPQQDVYLRGGYEGASVPMGKPAAAT